MCNSPPLVCIMMAWSQSSEVASSAAPVCVHWQSVCFDQRPLPVLDPLAISRGSS